MKLVMEALARLEEKIAELTVNQESTLKVQSNSSEISNSSRLVVVELQLKTQDTEGAGMDGKGDLAFEICSKVNCCNFTPIDYPYDQFFS